MSKPHKEYPLSILWHFIINGIQQTVFYVIANLFKLRQESFENICELLVKHTLHILNKEELWHLGSDETDVLWKELPTLIIKSLLLSSNTPSLTRWASYKAIAVRNALRVNVIDVILAERGMDVVLFVS